MNSREQLRDVVIDNWLFHDQLINTFEQGKQHDVPFMVGYTSSESSYMMTEYDLEYPKNKKQYCSAVSERFGDLTDDFINQYPSSDLKQATLASLGDGLFGWAAQKYARTASAMGSNTYLYYFDHSMSWAKKMGVDAFHGADVLLQYSGLLNYKPGELLDMGLPNVPAFSVTEEDLLMADMLMGYWASFAKQGDPNSKGRPEWPVFDRTGLSYIAFTEGQAHQKQNLCPGMFELHDKIVTKRREQEIVWFTDVGLLSPILSVNDFAYSTAPELQDS